MNLFLSLALPYYVKVFSGLAPNHENLTSPRISGTIAFENCLRRFGSRTPTATELIFGDNDFLHYVWNNNSAETWRWDGGPEIPMEEWALAAMSIQPKHATLYIYSDADGLTKGVNDIPHIEQQIGPLNIGWVDCCGGNRYFRGIIDEVMIFDRALSDDEILQLAEQGLAVEALNKLTTTWGRIKRSRY